MADKRISQLVDRGTVANNDVVPIVVSGATTTNKATISSIQTYMQGNLDLGVTSVGITLGSSGTDVSVSGSPITSSGNITINLPTASATNRGLLSAADWTTFNNKANAGDYVTLATTQTITAQKTFTTSGSSDTMIISHGSGSGFALDVLKAGNGEAIRVTKTSGSGNAMTISGGNFEAGTIVKTGGTSVQYLMADGSVSTLTNPVTGTGAAGQVAFWNGTNSQTGSNNLYWDNANVKLGIGISTPEATGLTVAGGGILVSLDSGAARKVLELYATSTGAKVSSTYVGSSSYGSLELLTSNIPRLTITAGGESTFSGALNGTSASFTGNIQLGTIGGGSSTSTPNSINLASTFSNTAGINLKLKLFEDTGGNIYGLGVSNGQMDFNVPSGATYRFYTGAATFSSSVTVQNAAELRVNRSDNTRFGSFFTDNLAVHLSSSNDPIRISSADRTEFYNAGTERMRITSGGDVEFNHSGGYITKIQANSQINATFNSGGASMYLNYQGNGAIYAGSSLQVLYAGSDERIKTDIEDAESTLDKVLSLKPRKFKYKERPDNSSYGFIAQEVEEVMPDLVRTFEGITMCLDEEIENQKSVESYSLVWASILVKAIQELKTEIDSLKNQMK